MKFKSIKLLLLLMSIASFAKAQKSEIYTTSKGAINGYDVVSFFTKKTPTKGNQAFSVNWKDAVWYFETKENADSFKVNPEAYCPQFGGYCAYGVSDNHKAPTQAETFEIINGKLYFNYNLKVKSMWIKDTANYIEKANNYWTTLKNKE